MPPNQNPQFTLRKPKTLFASILLDIHIETNLSLCLKLSHTNLYLISSSSSHSIDFSLDSLCISVSRRNTANLSSSNPQISLEPTNLQYLKPRNLQSLEPRKPKSSFPFNSIFTFQVLETKSLLNRVYAKVKSGLSF